MTPGERAVWAAEYVRARGMGVLADRAVEMAAAAVYALHASGVADKLSPDARAMLDDILGVGVEHVPVKDHSGQVIGTMERQR